MQGLTLLQEAVKNTRRPLSWVIGEDGSVAKRADADVLDGRSTRSRYQPSQRDLRTPERMRATHLAEPTTVGDAPLSKDLLGKKRR